jgi:hypothetical protein
MGEFPIRLVAIRPSTIVWSAVALLLAATPSTVRAQAPHTWNFINDQLVDEPLDPASASANVEAGVIYLHYLYHLKGGDGDATVASYFQGQHRDEVLPETQAYVGEIRADQADFAGG